MHHKPKLIQTEKKRKKWRDGAEMSLKFDDVTSDIVGETSALEKRVQAREDEVPSERR